MKINFYPKFFRFIFTSFLVIVLSSLSSCTTAPYSDRNQLIMTSKNEESQYGTDAWKQVLSDNKVSSNTVYRDRLNRVAGNLIKVITDENYKWEFIVIDSNQANAFCLPGGKIAVYSGLFDIVSNDAELAAVIAHEIGHALARHSGERMTHLYGKQIGQGILGIVIKQADVNLSVDWTKVYGIVSDVGVILPYSRVQEYEADHIGIMIMAKAGYNPVADLIFWEKFSKLASYGELQEFFTTHPMGIKRIKEIESLMPTAEILYNKATVKRNLGVVY